MIYFAKKNFAFTIVEILVTLLMTSIIAIFILQGVSKQSANSAQIAQKMKLEQQTKRVVEQLAAKIGSAGFNPRATNFPDSTSSVDRIINIMCMAEDKLYFNSDRLDENGIINNYNGLIDNIAQTCNDNCDCPKGQWDLADPRETTLYQFREDTNYPPPYRPLILYQNVRGQKNGSPLLTQIVRGKFKYFKKDINGKIDESNPFVPDSSPTICNICLLAMIRLELVVRGRSPIRGFSNETFVAKAPNQVKEEALVRPNSAGHYQTITITKDIFLKNRGCVKDFSAVKEPLCHRPAASSGCDYTSYPPVCP